jgi:transcriptional regulator with XRE-family HTH domain
MDLGLRQADVADRIGVWTSTVNYWENKHFNPEVQYVPKIVAFLGYDPFWPPPASFPLQLKAARIAAGLPRRQFAAQLKVHPYTVAKWERGEALPSKQWRTQLEIFIRSSINVVQNRERSRQRPSSTVYPEV